MSYIGNTLQVAYPSYTNIDDISGSFNGVTTSFALTVGGVAPVPAPLSSNQCMISVGGVIQRPDDTGTEGFRLSGGNIVFSSAPNTGEDFFGVILAGADYVNVGVNFPSGTASTPSITFDSDLDTGLYNPAANELGITTGGTSRLIVDSSGNVNIDSNTLYVDAVNNRVGVATTSPGFQFDCRGTGKFGDATRGAFLGVDSDIPYVQGYDSTGTYNQLKFLTGATEAARIDSSGRLLVGTSTSRIVEDLQGNGPQGLIQIEAANSDAIMSIISAGTADAGRAGTLSLGRHRNSTVGGTPTIVQDGDTLGAICFAGGDGVDMRTKGASIAAQVDGTPGANDMPGRLVFSTTSDGASSPTERMRITSGGDVLFGTTGIPNGTSIYGAAFESTSNNRQILKTASSVTTANSMVAFYNPNGNVGTISISGSATAYNTSSDYRLKENITPVTDGITRLQQLKPSRFNFIADPDTTVDGFIAHEAQAVVPECVTGEKDAVDENGNPEYQGIDQSKLVPLLTAALQEAVAEINALKDRLTAAGI